MTASNPFNLRVGARGSSPDKYAPARRLILPTRSFLARILRSPSVGCTARFSSTPASPTKTQPQSLGPLDRDGEGGGRQLYDERAGANECRTTDFGESRAQRVGDQTRP